MGLLKTAAKVAVASHVHGKVQRRQSQRWAAQDAAAAAAPAAAPVHAPIHADAPSPVAAPPAPPALSQLSATEEMLQQLERLGQLRAAGVLTDAEFETQKARILA